MAITRFEGKYDFLSNFYMADIEITSPKTGEVLEFPSTEHAYQAFKTLDLLWFERIRTAETPADAKRFGKKCPMRDDWDQIKDKVMLHVCRAKFNQHPDLAAKLLETGDRELIEGNWWNDTYWGVCKGVGLNKLGQTLMRIREELRSSK